MISAAGSNATWRYIDFFTGVLDNSNTRRAYVRACSQFFSWCEESELTLATIATADVARYVALRMANHETPGVQQQLAAIRKIFDWLCAGQILAVNPTANVRTPRSASQPQQKPVLTPQEWRRLLDSIPARSTRDLRDRALICTLTYAFAPISAALALHVRDLKFHGIHATIELPAKGGAKRSLPCHRALAEALYAYIHTGNLKAGSLMFRSSPRHDAERLTERAMTQPDAWRMIHRRAQAAGITTPIGSHSIRAAAITAYLAGGGTLEHAQTLAGHRSLRSTQLYEPHNTTLTHAEVERLQF